ncbi:DUF6454 family protein [Chitinophaga eiseniae]|uniref:Tat (Twin-arginine translocation) pathway signal sequence n=1 Tax=Chitinophaga eiseniae TaxID=634771 RepID=A0A847SVB7_9BACT|nr:DUF6454 family protein [Chitinophaga eiseniae]NLR82388.1 hypothetical protein [Chitinophaga eiseniae]
MPTRRDFLKHSLLPLGALCLSPNLESLSQPKRQESLLSKRLKSLTRHTPWNQVAATKIRFNTFHCQGMVRIGTDCWVSSVEVHPGNDRSSGAGHLFKIDADGNLLADIAVGEGAIFHPSGIDFDGTHIWIAAAEYRPDSRSIIYRFDPRQMVLEEVFRWNDHIGGIARNPDANTLHGISWGSRRFYQWALNETGKLRHTNVSPLPNHAYYIDYQDNQYLGGGEMLYTGLSTYKRHGKPSFSLGGIEIIDLEKYQPLHQVPVELWSPATDAVMTQNPSFFELGEGDKVRGYFMPDDNESTLFVYEASAGLR